MARPRIFVSSTFYDLRQVRSEIEQFVRQMGFEPVLNERGHIPYAHDKPLEDSCYEEIERVDMLVALVGGRFGSQSSHDTQSISQKEVETALTLKRPVYVFIERGVYGEYRTYLVNKSLTNPAGDSLLPSLAWHHCNDVRVFEFIERVLALPNNNAVFPFELAGEITTILREQWAGLFHSLLQRHAFGRHADLLSGLQSALSTASDLGKLLADESKRTTSTETVEAILMSNHPAFAALRKQMGAEYPTIFHTIDELDARMKAWGYAKEEALPFDEDLSYSRQVKGGASYRVTVSLRLFEETGKLRYVSPEDWRDDMLRREKREDADDDSPF